MIDFAALGDEVNLAARIASQAAAGEILVSRTALEAAKIDGGVQEWRDLTLKGIERTVAAVVLRVEV